MMMNTWLRDADDDLVPRRRAVGPTRSSQRQQSVRVRRSRRRRSRVVRWPGQSRHEPPPAGNACAPSTFDPVTRCRQAPILPAGGRLPFDDAPAAGGLPAEPDPGAVRVGPDRLHRLRRAARTHPLLRHLCVERRGWIDPPSSRTRVAACNLLPGPASTQLSIFCAWRVQRTPRCRHRRRRVHPPGLVLILLLAALFLASPTTLDPGAGAGAGAAVAAVACRPAPASLPASWRRPCRQPSRWLGYLARRASGRGHPRSMARARPARLRRYRTHRARARGADRTPVGDPVPRCAPAAAGGTAGTAQPLAWVAFKVGALSYGGGFVIIPLMQSDAVNHYHWMTNAQFLNAVALGQITPGPVVQTVAVVGYAAAGLARRTACRRRRVRPVVRLRPARRESLRPAPSRSPSQGVPRRSRTCRHRSHPGRGDLTRSRAHRDLAVRDPRCGRHHVAGVAPWCRPHSAHVSRSRSHRRCRRRWPSALRTRRPSGQTARSPPRPDVSTHCWSR